MQCAWSWSVARYVCALWCLPAASTIAMTWHDESSDGGKNPGGWQQLMTRSGSSFLSWPSADVDQVCRSLIAIGHASADLTLALSNSCSNSSAEQRFNSLLASNHEQPIPKQVNFCQRTPSSIVLNSILGCNAGICSAVFVMGPCVRRRRLYNTNDRIPVCNLRLMTESSALDSL